VLLLVLILVLIAFGLLVVALLSGSVLWAWVSVGVSVAAAAVLLVDWLQRRSAVRAGAEAGEAVPTPPASPVPPLHTPERESAFEPATEVIPTVSGGASPYDAAPPSGPDPAADGRRDERHDTRETVVMRAFAPPGSTGGPSGADGGIGSSSPISSPSVTNADGDGGSSPAWGGAGSPREGDRGSTDVDPDSETVKVVGAPGREPGAAQHGAPDYAAAPPAAATRQDLPPLGPDGAPPEEPRDADAAALVAGLDDEVFVVDELPRYHLGGCRSLGASPLIPLPAREAVELGFTPCAWCVPDRTLAARHRAPVR
jgi:hypothetical protein